MAEYTNEQTKWLRDRWKGHEKKIKALLDIIRTSDQWHESEAYKALINGLSSPPEGMETVEKDLRETDLWGANLSGADLGGADLSGAGLLIANLSGASLVEANLSGASLVEADLSGARLGGADLSGAGLAQANLSGASLWEANLSEASLEKANLSGAILEGADLSEASLWEANLSEAILRKANLSGADLGGADLSRTRLWGADLSGARLVEANLSGAHLEEVDLSRAILREAKVSGADLGGADLSEADLERAEYTTDEIFNRSVKWLMPWLWQHIPLISRLKNWEPLDITDFRGIDTTKVDASKNPVLKRHMDDYQFIFGFKEKSWFHRWIVYPLWKVTCDCGRSLLLWAFWSVVLALLFGWIYSINLDWFKQPNLQWFDVLYFSVVTFTTLGFGDVTPHYGNTAAQAWIMAEVIIGYIMLGGLISIFSNKLARRA